LQKWFTGTWRLIVLNSLSVPSTCPNYCYINTYISGGTEFEAFGNFDQNATFMPISAAVETEVIGVPQVGEPKDYPITQGGVNAPKATAEANVPVEDVPVGDSIVDAPNEDVPAVEITGEKTLGMTAGHERPVDLEVVGRDEDKAAELNPDKTAFDVLWSLPDMYKKLNILLTGNWTTAQAAVTALQTLRFPTDVLLTLTCGGSTHAAAWTNMRYVRWKSIDLTLVLNSNKFQVGSLIMYYGMLLDPNTIVSRLGGSNFAAQTTVPHVVCQAGLNNSVTLRLPWCSGLNYLSTENANAGDYRYNPFQELGTVVLSVWNALSVGAGQPATVSYSIFVEFNGFEAHVPRIGPSFGMAYEPEKPKEKNEDCSYVEKVMKQAQREYAYCKAGRPPDRPLKSDAPEWEVIGEPQIGEPMEEDVRSMKSHMQSKPKLAAHGSKMKTLKSIFGDSFTNFGDLCKRYSPYITLRNTISFNPIDHTAIGLAGNTTSVAFPVGVPIEHVPANSYWHYRGAIGAVGIMYGAWRGSLRYMLLHRVDKAVTTQNQVMFNPIDNQNLNSRFSQLGFDARTNLNDTSVSEYVADLIASDPSIYKIDTGSSTVAYLHNARGTTNAIDFTDDGASWNWVEVPFFSQYNFMKVPMRLNEGASPNGYFDHIVTGELVATTSYRTGQSATDLFDEITCLIAAGDDFRYGILYGAIPMTFRKFKNNVGANQGLYPAMYDNWQSFNA